MRWRRRCDSSLGPAGRRPGGSRCAPRRHGGSRRAPGAPERPGSGNWPTPTGGSTGFTPTCCRRRDHRESRTVPPLRDRRQPGPRGRQRFIPARTPRRSARRPILTGRRSGSPAKSPARTRSRIARARGVPRALSRRAGRRDGPREGPHGVAVLYDCHSIRSHIPFLFEGELPALNIGDNLGATCTPAIEATPRSTFARRQSGYTFVLNGRFKGGWTTRHYGRPADGVHAIQMEMAQSTYMDEAPPWTYRARLGNRICAPSDPNPVATPRGHWHLMAS